MSYDLIVTDPYGKPLEGGRITGAISFRYGQREMEVTKLTIILPDTFPDYLFEYHNRIYVYYRGKLEGDIFWLIDDVTRQMDAEGGWTVTVTAVTPLSLLTKRYAMDYSGTPRTVGIGEAAEVIWTIVYNAIGAGALGGLIVDHPARDISAFIELSPPPPDTPPAYKAFAWQQTLSTIVAIAQSSYERGTYLSFDITVQPNGKLRFQIYKDQRGIDRRNIITLSEEMGNLANIRHKTDYSKVATAVVAAGQGEELEREVVYVHDDERISKSPFGYSEYFRDARHIKELDALEEEAQSRLNDGRPHLFVQADFVERADTVWGVHVGFGDRVIAAVSGELFDCRIRAYEVTVADGNRDVRVELEGEPRLRRKAEQEFELLQLPQGEDTDDAAYRAAIESRIEDTEDEIEAARGGKPTLGDRLDEIEASVPVDPDPRLDALEAEIAAARGIYPALADRETQHETDISTIYGNLMTLQGEVVDARGGQVNLDTRLDLIEGVNTSQAASITALTRVSTRYSSNAGQALTSGSNLRINYEDAFAEAISHLPDGFVTIGGSWVFQPTIAGVYRITASFQMATANWASGDWLQIGITKNASTQTFSRLFLPALTSQAPQATITDLVYLNGSTDYIYITGGGVWSGGGSRNLSTDARHNYVSIDRV